LTYFFDSSALVKLYHLEPGSDKVQAIFSEPQRLILTSRLTVVELHSAFSLKVRTGRLSSDASASLGIRFLEDVATGVLTVISVRDLHYAAAERLIARYGNSKGLRTLDALQLAVALESHKRSAVDALVAADRTVVEIAGLEGVAAIDPAT
jgi:predicted nucleic acid-binding protein